MIPEAVGLSVLDLVCGLFGLIVVLYAITERVDKMPGVQTAPINLVKLEIEHTHTASLGLEIGVEGNIHRSWPDCIDDIAATWVSCISGQVYVLIESESPIESIRFMLMELPKRNGVAVFDDVDVSLTTLQGRMICTLSLFTGYRGDSRWGSQCREI